MTTPDDPYTALLDELAAVREHLARLPRAWRNRAYRRARHLHLEPPLELPHRARWAEPVIPDHIPAGMVPGNSNGSCFPWN